MTPTHAGTDKDFRPTGYSGQTNPPKLKPCPFCGGEVELKDKFDGADETSFIHCIKCHMWFEKFIWRGYGHAHIIKEWNQRVGE